MDTMRVGRQVLCAGLVVLAGCESDPTLAPIDVIPVAVVGEFGGLASGGSHACVPRITLSTGASTIQCWGADLKGQQGDGGAIPGPNRLTPGPVSSSGTFDRLAAGASFTCALPKNGGVPRCWGDNSRGQLGNGTRTNAAVPTLVSMPNGVPSFTRIDAGDDHVCALTPQGLGYCWGGNTYGQVGNSTNVDQLRPVPIFNGLVWTAISGGGEFTCAVSAAQDAYCWGKNLSGQYGVGDDDARWWYPHQKVESGHKWLTIKAGGAHTCGLRTDNWLWCWGDNSYGQIGKHCRGSLCLPGQPSFPLSEEQHIPRSVDWSSEGYSSMDLGFQHTCATRLVGGDVWCWGRNVEGQLGTSNTASSDTPVRVAGNLRATNIATGARFTVMTSVAGELWTWGLNTNGQLGDGTTINRPSPFKILP